MWKVLLRSNTVLCTLPSSSVPWGLPCKISNILLSKILNVLMLLIVGVIHIQSCSCDKIVLSLSFEFTCLYCRRTCCITSDFMESLNKVYKLAAQNCFHLKESKRKIVGTVNCIHKGQHPSNNLCIHSRVQKFPA